MFGAILIFLLGTIIRSAVGNSYTQNQNFKAMRMAMLASWQGSESAQGLGASANLSHTSASILFVEDRLSPDMNKYGDLDRNPFIAQGSGSFSYEMLYPLDVGEAAGNNLPIMDVYINGVHFPFTTASYVPSKTITRPQMCEGAVAQSPSAAQSACLAGCSPSDTSCEQHCQLVEQAQCGINQCLRNAREWVGGTVSASQFETVMPLPPNTVLTSATDTILNDNANAIINALAAGGYIFLVPGSSTQYNVTSTALVS